MPRVLHTAGSFWQVGFVVEVSEGRLDEVVEAYKASGVEAVDIGRVTDDGKVGRT